MRAAGGPQLARERPEEGAPQRARGRRGGEWAISFSRVTMRGPLLRQYSMIRVSEGVIPDVRTGLIVTFPALPDASSI